MKWFRRLSREKRSLPVSPATRAPADNEHLRGTECLSEPEALRAAVGAVQRAHDRRRLADFICWAEKQKALHEILWLDLDPRSYLSEPLPPGWLRLLEVLFEALYEASDADQCDTIRLISLGIRGGTLDVGVRGASAMQFGMIRLASRLSTRTCACCGAPAAFDAIFKMPRCERHRPGGARVTLDAPE